MTIPGVLLFLEVVVASGMDCETPRSRKARLTNEMRTSDIVILVVAVCAALIFAGSVTLSLVRQHRRKSSAKVEPFDGTPDDDVIIKTDVSGKPDAATSNKHNFEDILGTLGVALFTCCLVAFFLNFNDD